MIGVDAPGINGIRLNYKQNSFEKRVIKALHIMASRIEAMEVNYCLLTEEVQEIVLIMINRMTDVMPFS